MTTSAYPVLTEIESAFKAIIWDPMIKAGEVWIAGAEASIPILDLPFIQKLEDGALELLTNALFAQIILFIDVNAIKLKNAEMQSAWSTSAEALTLISQEKGVNSDEYKKALSTAAADFAKWVHTGP